MQAERTAAAHPGSRAGSCSHATHAMHAVSRKRSGILFAESPRELSDYLGCPPLALASGSITRRRSDVGLDAGGKDAVLWDDRRGRAEPPRSPSRERADAPSPAALGR